MEIEESIVNELEKLEKFGELLLGECSYQIHFRLKNGKILRFMLTDSDVAKYPNALVVDIIDNGVVVEKAVLKLGE